MQIKNSHTLSFINQNGTSAWSSQFFYSFFFLNRMDFIKIVPKKLLLNDSWGHCIRYTNPRFLLFFIKFSVRQQQQQQKIIGDTAKKLSKSCWKWAPSLPAVHPSEIFSLSSHSWLASDFSRVVYFLFYDLSFNQSPYR